MGIRKALESTFQTFNNYLSNITRKRNASIVGPTKQITGEYPPVDFQSLYDYYHHWDQVKKAIDTMHQKFMGSGLRIEIEDGGKLKTHVSSDGVVWYLARSRSGGKKGWAKKKELRRILN